MASGCRLRASILVAFDVTALGIRGVGLMC